jgi:hypothetical protein
LAGTALLVPACTVLPMTDPDAPYKSLYEPHLGGVFMSTAAVRTHPPGSKPSHVIGTGVCPRCGHAVNVYHRATTQSFFGDDEPIVFRQHCDCETEHAGAPKDTRGCGSVWLVELPGGN